MVFVLFDLRYTSNVKRRRPLEPTICMVLLTYLLTEIHLDLKIDKISFQTSVYIVHGTSLIND